MNRFVINEIKDGFVFILKANNGRALASSHIYKNKKATLNAISLAVNNAPLATIEDQTKADYIRSKYPKFEIYIDQDNKYRYRLKKDKNKEIMFSESYASVKNCIKGIILVKNILRIRR